MSSKHNQGFPRVWLSSQCSHNPINAKNFSAFSNWLRKLLMVFPICCFPCGFVSAFWQSPFPAQDSEQPSRFHDHRCQEHSSSLRLNGTYFEGQLLFGWRSKFVRHFRATSFHGRNQNQQLRTPGKCL